MSNPTLTIEKGLCAMTVQQGNLPEHGFARPAQIRSDPMNNFRFYVIEDAKRRKNGDPCACPRNLSLNHAMQFYRRYDEEKPSILGVSGCGIDTDLVQRIDGENTLVTDYLEMDEWRHNPYL